MTNPRTAAYPGYEYERPVERKVIKIKSLQTKAIAYELTNDGKRAIDGAVLFADGHVTLPK